MKHPLKLAFLLPAALAALTMTSCVVPGGYATLGNGYGNTGSSAYYHQGRTYSGGRYETGQFHDHGQAYNNRYYHNGHYYYGGSHGSHPGTVTSQSRYRQDDHRDYAHQDDRRDYDRHDNNRAPVLSSPFGLLNALRPR